MTFAGQAFLITGGASGIGLAVARLVVQQGGAVGILDRDATALAQATSQMGGACHGLPCDVSDPVQVQQAVSSTVERLGRLNAVVNGAGVDHVARLDEITDEAWQRTLAVNLTGTMVVCRAAVPHLRRSGGGTIVNISSGAGLSPLPGRSAYCATKAGVIMFSKALAMELAADHIRVNAVCPGAVDTPLFRSSWEEQQDPQGTLQTIKERYALKRVAAPEEIAQAVLYLSSSASSYVTGTAHAVDGGRTFH